MKLYGNKIVVESISNSILNDKVGHSYLFYGEDGIGKLSACILFAKSLLCPNFKANAGFACGVCPCCKKIESHNHPDLHIHRSFATSNSIHVDLMRSIKSESFKTPNESLYNIFIIENCQNMTISAFNAILKLIEEPPGYSIFMLTCTNKSLIPPTITSRTINYKLLPISYDECFNLVRKRYPTFELEKLNFYVNISGGVVGKALQLLETQDFIYDISYSFLKNVALCGNLSAFYILQKAAVKREVFVQVLDTINLILNVAISCSFKSDLLKFNYNFLVESFSYQQLFDIYDIIRVGIDNLKYNCNLNLTSTFIFSKIQSLKIRRC